MADHPLWQLTLVRFREFLREPEALFWVFGFPLLLAAGLGLAFRNAPAEVVSIGFVGADRAAFEQAPSLAVDAFPTLEEGLRALREGRIALLVERPALGAVVYHYDDTNPQGRDARMRADLAVQQSAGRVDPVAAREELMRETGSRYIDFLVPGLLGMNLMGGSIWSMGFAIVDARRRKLMKRLIATPMSRSYFLLSFLISRLAMLVIEVGAFIGFAVLVFGVPIRGSLILVAGICILGSLAFGAIGLLLSSRARTIEAASGLMNLTMLPMWILSGVFFSSQRFPDAVQPIIAALPLTALNDALRATMLQGATFAQIAPEAGVLAAWLLVSFPIALKLFRWR
ncbi:MAG TPA: ABC transporter permease [Gammaproteobacteria bacterium]|nr:ABC transporter permease [Gammaproteobacteria bacterium]